LLADKLSETKKAEREAKEAHKAALQASKQKNQEVSNKRLNTVWFLRHCCNGFQPSPGRHPSVMTRVIPGVLKLLFTCREKLLKEQLSRRFAQ